MKHRACLLILLVLFFVGGCASVPLGTMWKLRNFEPADLAKLEPSEIRVATLIQPGPQKLDPERSKLVLQLEPRDGGETEIHQFGLMFSTTDSAIPPGQPHVGWQNFALNDAGTTAFRSLHPQLVSVKDNYKSLTFKVQFGLVEAQLQERPSHLNVSARLRLASDQNVLTLLDGARIAMNYESATD